jgi:hypothetical protein
MPTSAPKTEQILFRPPTTTSTDANGNITTFQPDTVELIINPETLTLLWKKVLNRQRTKTRLVTLFWGESPVKFTYRGQTGYAYPTITEITAGASNQQASMQATQANLIKQINELQFELNTGGPYTYVTIDGDRAVIQNLSNQLNNLTSNLFAGLITPRTTLLQNLNTQFTNTQILYLSERFKKLKALEAMYRVAQDPSGQLVQVFYRDYIFEGYFESFGYTDDAKNPWNWFYNLDFTILKWKENPAATITATGEIIFDGSKNVQVTFTTPGSNTITTTTIDNGKAA